MVANLTTDLAAKAPLISPSFTTPNIGLATASGILSTGHLQVSASGTTARVDNDRFSVLGDTFFTTALVFPISPAADYTVNMPSASGTLALTSQLPAANTGVVGTKAHGTRTAHPPAADTYSARGLALEAAFAAAVAGDTIDLSPGNYYINKTPATVAAIVSQFLVLDKMTVRLNGARLYKQSADTASCMFSMAVVSMPHE